MACVFDALQVMVGDGQKPAKGKWNGDGTFCIPGMSKPSWMGQQEISLHWLLVSRLKPMKQPNASEDAVPLPAGLLSHFMLCVIKQSCRNAMDKRKTKNPKPKKETPRAEAWMIVWDTDEQRLCYLRTSTSCVPPAGCTGCWRDHPPPKPLRNSPGPAGATLCQRQTPVPCSSHAQTVCSES